MTDLQHWKGLPKFKKLPRKYSELAAIYQPRPIHGAAELDTATKMIDAMAGHDLNADQSDYLDLVSSLVEAYEEEHSPVRTGNMSPREAVQALLEESGMSASEFGRLLGSRDLGSKILRGARGLSLSHVAILAERFAVGADLFIPPSKRQREAAVKGRAAVSWRNGKVVRTP